MPIPVVGFATIADLITYSSTVINDFLSWSSRKQKARWQCFLNYFKSHNTEKEIRFPLDLT